MSRKVPALKNKEQTSSPPSQDATMFRAFAETTIHPLVITDSNGRIVFFNRGAEQQFQVSASDVMGKNVRRLVPEPFRSEHDSYIRNYRDGAEGAARRGVLPKLVEAMRSDGSIFPARLTIIDVDVVGERCFIASLEDQTLNNLLAEKQMRSEASSVFVMKGQPDAIIVASREGVIQVFSGASEKMFGIKEADAVGQRVEIIMPEPYKSYHPSYIENYLEFREKSVVDSFVDAKALNVETGKEFPVRVKLFETTLEHTAVFMAVISDTTEIVKQKEARDTIYSRHSKVINSIVGALIAIDVTGHILLVNHGATELLGWEEHEMIGEKVEMMIPEPFKSQHDSYLARVLQTGQKTLLGDADGRSVSAQLRDGTHISVQITLTESVVDGKVVYVGLLNDKMEEEQQMEQLAKAEAKAHSVIESAVDAVVTCDEAGRIEEFNPSAERMFGYLKKEVMGLKVNLLMPSPYNKQHDKYMQSYYDTGIKKVVGIDREIVGLRKDGSTVPMEIRLSEVCVDQSRTFTAILRDIEERTRSIMELRKSEERTRRIFDSATDGIVTCDVVGKIMSVNNSMCEMFGWHEDEIVGENVRMLMPSPYSGEHDSYLARYRQTGVRKIIGSLKPREVAGLKKAGEVFPIELSLSESDIGMGVLYTATLRDITARKEAEERVAASITKTKAIMSGATDGIIVMDDQGKIEMINEAACVMFEVAEFTAVGQNIKILMPEPFHSNHDQYLRAYILTGIRKVIGFDREVSGKRLSSGEIFPVGIAVSEVNAGSRRVFTGILRDLTVDQKQKLIVQKKEKQLLAVIEQAVDAVIVINQDGIVSTFNPAAERMWGYSSEQVLGNNVNMLMPEPFRSEHDNYLKSYTKTGIKKIIGNQGREVVIMKENGDVVPIQISVSESVIGSSWQFTAIVVEITTRKLIEAKLKRSQMQMQMLFETATNGVITIDDAGIILEINPAAAQMFGYDSKDEIMGHNVNVLIPPGVAEKHDDYLKEYKVTGKKSMIGSTKEVRGRKKNDEKIDVEISVAESTVGSSRTFQAILVDITTRKKREEAANIRQHRLNAMIESCAYGMVVIDDQGMILIMNEKARVMFARSYVGEKVNLLMPEPFRSDHDTYIARYFRTKKKTVIGLTRSVAAVRHNIKFPVELAVEESSVFGKSIFIATIRDMSNCKQSTMLQPNQLLVLDRPGSGEDFHAPNRAKQIKEGKSAHVQVDPMLHYTFKDEWKTKY